MKQERNCVGLTSSDGSEIKEGTFKKYKDYTEKERKLDLILLE